MEQNPKSIHQPVTSENIAVPSTEQLDTVVQAGQQLEPVAYERISLQEAVYDPSRQYEQTLQNLERQLTNTLTVLTKLVRDLAVCDPVDEASLESGIRHETMCLTGYKSIIREVKRQRADLIRHASENYERQCALTEQVTLTPITSAEYSVFTEEHQFDQPTIRFHIKEWLAMDIHDFELNLMRRHEPYNMFGYKLFELCIDSMDSATIAHLRAKASRLRNQEMNTFIRQQLQASIDHRQLSIS